MPGLLPAFLENMFTEALGAPPGPGAAACGAVGSDIGGGGGAFFCRGTAGSRNLLSNPDTRDTPQTEASEGRASSQESLYPTPFQRTSSSGSLVSTHRFFFSSQTICHSERGRG